MALLATVALLAACAGREGNESASTAASGAATTGTGAAGGTSLFEPAPEGAPSRESDAATVLGEAGEAPTPVQPTVDVTTPTPSATAPAPQSAPATAPAAAATPSQPAPAEAANAGTETAAAAADRPVYRRGDVPEIWISVAQGQGDALPAVLYAIDSDRNGSVGNDQTLQIRPLPTTDGAGECDIQTISARSYPGSGPVFSAQQANQGIAPSEMPRYLAFAATEALVQSGLYEDREDTAGHNICARKYWELWLSKAEPIRPRGS
ncbi:MAG: hypothetical protein AAFR52_11285 [Pseudomonadota bacterium]